MGTNPDLGANMGRLTDIFIRHKKPAEKTYKLFDGDGLYLEISPAGGKHWPSATRPLT
jgi:hypothetical protein